MDRGSQKKNPGEGRKDRRILALNFMSLALVFNRRRRRLEIVQTHQEPCNADEAEESIVGDYAEEEQSQALQHYLEASNAAITMLKNYNPKNSRN